MTEVEIKATIRSNAEIVLGALQSLKGPASIDDVALVLAAVHKLDPSKIREPVKEILQTGHKIGILTKKRGKYTLDTDIEIESDFPKLFAD